MEDIGNNDMSDIDEMIGMMKDLEIEQMDKREQMNGLLSGMVLGNFCLNCGEPLTQKPTGRRRHFCCVECSREYWKKNPRPDRWKSYERVRCQYCRKLFYGRKDAHRKFCSVRCSNLSRGMKRIVDEMNTDESNQQLNV